MAFSSGVESVGGQVLLNRRLRLFFYCQYFLDVRTWVRDNLLAGLTSRDMTVPALKQLLQLLTGDHSSLGTMKNAAICGFCLTSKPCLKTDCLNAHCARSTGFVIHTMRSRLHLLPYFRRGYVTFKRIRDVHIYRDIRSRTGMASFGHVHFLSRVVKCKTHNIKRNVRSVYANIHRFSNVSNNCLRSSFM